METTAIATCELCGKNFLDYEDSPHPICVDCAAECESLGPIRGIVAAALIAFLFVLMAMFCVGR